MKIRKDFVTNSSSVSYIVSVKKSNLEKLVNLIQNSPEDMDGEKISICRIYSSIENADYILTYWLKRDKVKKLSKEIPGN